MIDLAEKNKDKKGFSVILHWEYNRKGSILTVVYNIIVGKLYTKVGKTAVHLSPMAHMSRRSFNMLVSMDSFYYSCLESGYIGCCTSVHGALQISCENGVQDLTIPKCVSLCHNTYAGLYQGNMCFCWSASTTVSHMDKVEDKLCSSPCVERDIEKCGGDSKIALFDSKSILHMCVLIEEKEFDRWDLYYLRIIFVAC